MEIIQSLLHLNNNPEGSSTLRRVPSRLQPLRRSRSKRILRNAYHNTMKRKMDSQNVNGFTRYATEKNLLSEKNCNTLGVGQYQSLESQNSINSNFYQEQDTFTPYGPLDENQNNILGDTPFKHTKKWFDIIRYFTQNMPLKSHSSRFGLKSWENSFSGSEAVEFLQHYLSKNIMSTNKNANPPTKDQIVLLLTKFMEQKIIKGVDRKQVEFRSGAYHFYWMV